MPVFAMEEDRAAATVVQHPAHAASERDVIERYHAEILGYLHEMNRLPSMEPDEALLHLSAWGARVTEIRCSMVRNEGRAAQGFRTRVVEPFLKQLEFQFNCHSRIQACRELDYKITRGAPA